jgi:RNA polymerase sigma-70 factor (ECF subfamily)
MTNPAASFEPYRRRLLGLAYRMLGSMADAEDAVQEAYLRWHHTDRDVVSDPKAFLMTTTTRICLDLLTSARARREEYVGPWLPEPVVDAAALDRTEAACRQLASRARAHVKATRPRGATAPGPHQGEGDAKHAQLMAAFVAATSSGDLDGLTRLLASDVRVVTDGGGKVAAALNVIDGADRAARFLIGAARKGWRDDFTLRFAPINDLPGVIVDSPEGTVQTTAFEIDDGVIRAIYVVRNPDKLRHLDGTAAAL